MFAGALSLRAYRLKREAGLFKGTLLSIVVSFFILIFLSFIINLAENYYYGQQPTDDSRQTTKEQKNNDVSGKDSDFLSFNRLFGIKTAYAATFSRLDYKASFFVNSSDKLSLEPGSEATYRVGFKNTGKADWYNNGTNFVSVYTYNPKYRKSSFRGNGWYKYNQPAKMKESKVAPGQLGYIEFKLKAPATEGSYTETFYLAAEDKAWIEGGQFNIPIIVKTKKAGNSTQPASQIINYQLPITNAAANFQALLMIKNTDKVQAKAGDIVDLRFGFKNTGKIDWDIRSILVPDEELKDDGTSIFYTPTWTSGHQPMANGVTATKPGEIGYVDFKIKAPEAAGIYSAKFKLIANYNQTVEGGEVDIPVYVTDETAGSDQSGRVQNVLNMSEPAMEIGLSYMETSNEAVELTSDQAYQLIDKNNNFLASFSAYESARITYNFSSKIFSVQNARLALQITGELRFKGINENTVFTILSMSRLTSDGINDNKYRGEIILRYADTTQRLWTINRLPMEHYLWGIAETSNISPIEYIKSIIVASRTYALYHYLNPYKYNGYFTMKATTADQLYRGYNSELRRSRVKQAAEETRGQVITYSSDIVVTPYFGHSDGKTRGWSSVFGGKDKAWLVPVSAPYDAGLSMFGHGVGMSANDAYGHAKDDLWGYVKILKYYYSGIEVSRVY